MAALGTGGKKESTEWEDILKEKGVIPEKTEEELIEEALSAMIDETAARYDPNERKNVEQLDEELEEADSEEERILNKHRDRRLQDVGDTQRIPKSRKRKVHCGLPIDAVFPLSFSQIKAQSMRKRYGPGVLYISAQDWTAEVTNADKDAFVVVHLVRSTACCSTKGKFADKPFVFLITFFSSDSFKRVMRNRSLWQTS